MDPAVCPFCNAPITPLAYFCPTCGKKLKDPPVGTGIGKQIKLYLICVLLPPLGLFPGIKYLRQEDPKAQKIGLVVILLTIIATIFTIWFSVAFVSQLSSTLNGQLDQFQGASF